MNDPSPLSIAKASEHPQMASKSEYQKQLKKWQKQLTQVQQAYYHQGRRAIVVFEGWDAAGKGGAIRRVTERLDPRGFQVYPIGKPTAEEQGKHYMYRFFTKLPTQGTIAIFDRSYYGRVLVERVDELANVSEWSRAYQEINNFEKSLTDDGVRIIKLFLHIDADEQRQRFVERLHNPLKRWKLTHEDLHNRSQRLAYESAIDEMFARTHTAQAPWHLILANYKWYTRVEILRVLVEQLSAGVDLAPPAIDVSLVKRAEEQLGV